MSGLLPLLPYVARTPADDESIFKEGAIPKELDVFYRDEAYFLPEGKTFADLTDEEMAALRSKYRFSPLKPGLNQAISGRNGRHGSMLS